MSSTAKTKIEIEVTINAPIEKVWNLWTNPEHIVRWNYASDDWHTTRAENDLKAGGRFVSRMESKDGKMGFDFSGKYDRVDFRKLIEYTLDDTRKVVVKFDSVKGKTTIFESFEAENQNTHEMQKLGWQAILDNFRNYAESSSSI